MPPPVQPESASASNAPISATPALSAATPSRATAQAARPVIAPFGRDYTSFHDAPLPTYCRPLYPFEPLNPTEARLLPPPKDLRFDGRPSGLPVVQEFALKQGYKLEPYRNWTHGLALRCKTGSKCQYSLVFRWLEDEDQYVVEPKDEDMEHTHGPSLRIGTNYWSRGLTEDEANFIEDRKSGGHLRTIEDAQAVIEASRKRLSDRIPMPKPSHFLEAWNRNGTSSPSGSEPESTNGRTSPTVQSAPAASAAPARPVRSSAAVQPVDEDWLEVVRMCESIKPGRRSTSRYVNYRDDGPWNPPYVLDPAKCCLRPPPSGQIFYDQAKAAYLLQTYALLQGYELKTDLGSMDAFLQCQGAPGCPYELILRGRGRHKVWDLEDCHERHNHPPNPEAGLRVWRRGLTEAEIKYIKTRKRQGKLETIVDARVAIELSRKRAGGYIPMPMPSAYDAVWDEEDNAGGNGNKRMRLASTSRLPVAAPVVPSRVANSSNALPPPSFASISGSTIPSAPFPMAPYFHPATSQNELINGLGHMIIQLWPYGVSDPQSKVRAAVKAMLDLDVQQQQQQQQQQQHSRP